MILPADASYQCLPVDPDRVRLPDVSFIRRGRLRGERLRAGHIRIAPDLAVEVAWPNDLFGEARRKVEEDRAARVGLVWVVDPDTRTVEVLRLSGALALLRGDDVPTAQELLPGFSCRIRDLAPALPPISDGETQNDEP